MKKENKGTDITLSLLLVAFVVLKLCGVIDWPWIWVLSPIWIPLIIAGIVLLAVFGWKAIKTNGTTSTWTRKQRSSKKSGNGKRRLRSCAGILQKGVTPNPVKPGCRQIV